MNGPSGITRFLKPPRRMSGLRGMGWLSDFIDTLGALVIDDLAGDVRMSPMAMLQLPDCWFK